MSLWRISAPHFTAGFVVTGETKTITTTAPIVRYMRGKRLVWATEYCASKKWKCEPVPTPSEEEAMGT